MNAPVLEFVWRGQVVRLPNVPPTHTLLQLLRDDLGHHATKEGCNEGDCGACTVVLGEPQGQQLRYLAVNSCIKLAHAIHGMVLFTAADLAAPDGTPHPVQQALHQCHASQCGFCTPGFAMSLFGLYQNRANVQTNAQADVSREQAQQALSGNLCRCTGYRPILDAAQHMIQLPKQHVDEAKLLQLCEQITQQSPGPEADFSYKTPKTLSTLLAHRAAHPEAQIVAGCTDVGLWVNKLHMGFSAVLDVTQVHELRQVHTQPSHLEVGAAVSLTDAFAALQAERPALQAFFNRFAGMPVRNAGTLGGNVANGSPIGDSMPLLLALGASVVLMSVRGSRELPLDDFYLGYRKTALAADEVLTHVRVPRPQPGEVLKVFKVSKRFEDDISAVCLAIRLHHQQGRISQASVGVGGVAATPVRAHQTQAALTGQPWHSDTIAQAATVLKAEFSPISDMRASAAYRTEVLGNLLQRFWLETQDPHHTPLAQLTALDVAPNTTGALA